MDDTTKKRILICIGGLTVVAVLSAVIGTYTLIYAAGGLGLGWAARRMQWDRKAVNWVRSLWREEDIQDASFSVHEND